MKLHLTPTVSARTFETALADAMRAGANCAIVTPLGRKPYTYNLPQLSTFIGHTAEIVFGKRIAPGLPVRIVDAPDFVVPPPVPPVSLNDGGIVTPTEVKVEQVPVVFTINAPEELDDATAGAMGEAIRKISARMVQDVNRRAVRLATAPATKPAPRPRPSRAVSGTPANRSQGSGFIAAIDKLLLDTAPGKVQGRVRSKHSVDDVVQKMLRKFPGKSPASIKRVVKVRPRHLEKVKGANGFHETDNPAPRWAWVGPGHGTGFMHRIDEFLTQGGKTGREIAQVVAKEYNKDLKSALKVVQMRTSQYETKHGKPAKFVRVKAPARTTAQVRRDRVALKRRNLAALRAAARR